MAGIELQGVKKGKNQKICQSKQMLMSMTKKNCVMNIHLILSTLWRSIALHTHFPISFLSFLFIFKQSDFVK